MLHLDTFAVVSYTNWNLDADSTDGIESIFADAVDTDKTTADGQVYDLNGRRLSAIQRGRQRVT